MFDATFCHCVLVVRVQNESLCFRIVSFMLGFKIELTTFSLQNNVFHVFDVCMCAQGILYLYVNEVHTTEKRKLEKKTRSKILRKQRSKKGEQRKNVFLNLIYFFRDQAQ